MNIFGLLLFTDRPMVQAFFSSLEQVERQPLVINFLPLAVQALVLPVHDLNSATVAAVDVASNPVTAIQVCQELHDRRPGLPILGICCAKEVNLLHIQALVAAGVTSILDSFVTSKEILRTLERIANGHIIIQLDTGGNANPFLIDIIGSLTESSRTSSSGIFISDDVRLLRHVAYGLSDREIGQRLYVSQSTVHHRIERLCKMTGARNRTELAAWAGKWGLHDSSLNMEESVAGR